MLLRSGDGMEASDSRDSVLWTASTCNTRQTQQDRQFTAQLVVSTELLLLGLSGRVYPVRTPFRASGAVGFAVIDPAAAEALVDFQVYARRRADGAVAHLADLAIATEPWSEGDDDGELPASGPLADLIGDIGQGYSDSRCGRLVLQIRGADTALYLLLPPLSTLREAGPPRLHWVW